MSHRKEVAALLPIAKARGLRAVKFDEVVLFFVVIYLKYFT